MESAATIVARYLKANNYTGTYDAFVQEAGLAPDAGDVKKGQLTLETLLDEKATFDLTVRAEKLGVSDETASRWTNPAPQIANVVSNLSGASNILDVAVHDFQDESGNPSQQLIASTADRKLHLIDVSSLTVRQSLTSLHDSPILSFAVLGEKDILTTSMSGQLNRSDGTGQVLDKRQDHSKYVVKVVVSPVQENGQQFIATAGWDLKVHIYSTSAQDLGDPLGSPLASIGMTTKPEAIVFTRHPDSGKTVLLVTRTDCTFISFYAIDASFPDVPLLGGQNLAPYSNSWVAMSPAALAISPTDPELLAVATSSFPEMKLMIVRILFPPWVFPTQTPSHPSPSPNHPVEEQSSSNPPPFPPQTQSRAALALAEREDAAIQINCNTLAPLTAYSTPALAWRPDGSGVWVNGDDGVVRGIEACSGKVVTLLKGHDGGSKVRCLWAGTMRGREREGDEEVLVSGGFDQRLIVWRLTK